MKNVFHWSYILLLTSYFIRFFNNTILEAENLFFSLLLYSLIALSFVIHTKYKKSVCILIIPFFLLFLELTGERISFFLILYTFYIVKYCEIKFVIYSTLLFSITSVLVMICLVGLGITENIGKVFPGGFFERGVRYDLGFGNPNSASLFLGSTLLLTIYVTKFHFSRNIQVLVAFIGSFIIYTIFMVTGTMTLVICWVIFCLVIFFKNILINNITIIFIRVFPLFILGLFYFMAINYNNNVVILIDIFTSGRIGLFRDYLVEFSVADQIFGSSRLISMMRETHNPVDNVYNFIFLSNGLVGFIIFYVMYLKSVNHYFYIKDYLSMGIIIYYLFYGITELSFANISHFPHILFWILLSRTNLPSENIVLSKNTLAFKVFSHSRISIAN